MIFQFFKFCSIFAQLNHSPLQKRAIKLFVTGPKLDKPVVMQASLSPCKRSEQGGSKFNLKKKSTHPRIWCQRNCLSVCLSVVNFDPNYLRTGKTEWAKKLGIFFHKNDPHKNKQWLMGNMDLGHCLMQPFNNPQLKV